MKLYPPSYVSPCHSSFLKAVVLEGDFGFWTNNGAVKSEKDFHGFHSPKDLR
jgi:hypothetical protein